MDQVSHIVPLVCLACLIPLAMYLGWRWGRSTALAREEYAAALREIIHQQDAERKQLLDRILLVTGNGHATTLIIDPPRREPEQPKQEFNLPDGWVRGSADYNLEV